MNSLTQLENGIFATEEALEELSKKDKASILTISDTHGASQMMELIIKEFGKKSDAIIFTGDGIYDLLSVMEKAQENRKLAECLPPVIAFVRGNNDPISATAAFSEHVRVPAKVVLKAGSRTILLTHGHNESVYYDVEGLKTAAQTYEADSVIYGHTHVPSEFQGTTYTMNPGSVGYPRSGSQAGFAQLEISGKNIFAIFYRISTVNGTQFIPYFPDQFSGW